MTTNLYSDGGLIARVPASLGTPENYCASVFWGRWLQLDPEHNRRLDDQQRSPGL